MISRLKKESSHSSRMIRIHTDTYHQLAKLGTLEDSFDTVLRRLLDKHSQLQQKQKQVVQQE